MECKCEITIQPAKGTYIDTDEFEINLKAEEERELYDDERLTIEKALSQIGTELSQKGAEQKELVVRFNGEQDMIVFYKDLNGKLEKVETSAAKACNVKKRTYKLCVRKDKELFYFNGKNVEKKNIDYKFAIKFPEPKPEIVKETPAVPPIPAEPTPEETTPE